MFELLLTCIAHSVKANIHFKCIYNQYTETCSLLVLLLFPDFSVLKFSIHGNGENILLTCLAFLALLPQIPHAKLLD